MPGLHIRYYCWKSYIQYFLPLYLRLFHILLYVSAVVVSPHGMQGKLTGCCPGDLVKQVYFRFNHLLLSHAYVSLAFIHHLADGQINVLEPICYWSISTSFIIFFSHLYLSGQFWQVEGFKWDNRFAEPGFSRFWLQAERAKLLSWSYPWLL